ncbi:MAG: serine/threonine-protein kinase, partial [Myxococcales bacterium]
VVKVLLSEFVEEPEALQMFLDEARITAHLNHPNISRILDLGREGGTFFLAAEYVHGVDAASLLRALAASGRQLPVALAAHVGAEVAAGLDYAHRAVDENQRPLRLIHRDVSPPNLMLGFDGGVKLIDFGVAKVANRLVRTATGRLKGKAAYMSPEQARGELIDQRSDIFSLGIVLWELATSGRLFRRKSEIAALQAVIEAPIPPPSSLNPEIDPRLEAILVRTLERNPARRFQTASELGAALRGWLAAEGAATAARDLGAFLRLTFPDLLDLGDTAVSTLPTGRTAVSPRRPTAPTVPAIRRRLEPLGADSLVATITERAEGPPGEEPSASAASAAPATPRRRAIALALLAALAGAALAIGLSQLLRPAAAPATQAFQPTLAISTVPPGALVRVDGKAIGHTPIQGYRLDPARPAKLNVSLDGFEPLERELTGTESVSLELALTPRVASRP